MWCPGYAYLYCAQLLYLQVYDRSVVCDAIVHSVIVHDTIVHSIIVHNAIVHSIIVHSVIVHSIIVPEAIVHNIIVYGYHCAYQGVQKYIYIHNVYIHIFVQFWRSDILAKRQLANFSMTDEVNYLSVRDIRNSTQAETLSMTTIAEVSAKGFWRDLTIEHSGLAGMRREN